MINQLKQPLNIIMLSLTVISIGLTVFFYQKSKKTRSISYQITQPIFKIFDAKNTTHGVQFLLNESVLTDNVYLLTGKIWNSGNLPIHPSDVRKELTIELDISNRIIDYEIINEKESGISNFELDSISENKLRLYWDYFDPNYGFVFQIMFLSKNDNPNFQLNGKVLDVSKFKEIDFAADDRTFNKWSSIIFSFFVLIFIIFTIVNRIRKDYFRYWFMLIMFCFALMFAVYSICKYFSFFEKIPI